MILYLLTIILICTVVILYRNINYWKYKKVKYIKPWPLLGCFGKNVFRQLTFVEQLQFMYNRYPEARFIGIHQMTYPMILIRDPELIKQICVKNFDSFMNHKVIFTEDIDPLFGKSLISLEGQRWRDMRATLSPAFTSSKMRTMYVLIRECAEQFCQYFRDEAKDGVCEVEMKDILRRYTNDVIATTAFGITCDSLKDKENVFYETGKKITGFVGLKTTLKFLLSFIFPKLMKTLGITLLDKDVGDFFRDIIRNTIVYREKNGVVRPDMIHLLMEARNGRLKHEKPRDDDAGFATVEESNIGKESKKTVLTNEDITAQAVLFFLAGYDTSSTLMSFLTYELAVNVDIQKTLQNEIDTTFEKCNNVIDYDALLKMKYLDMVVSECLRKWPPAPITERICSEDFTVTDGDVTLVVEKNQSVSMPVYSLHHDTKYFPEPERFDPERFNDENKSSIVPFSYMPFGHGPRNCIGSRFALLEIKALTVYLLKNFDLVVTKKTQIPLQLSKNMFAMQAENGIHLGLKPRK